MDMRMILDFLITYLTFGWLSFFVTYMMYSFVFTTKNDPSKQTPVRKTIAYILAFVGLILDVLWRVIYGSVLFLQLPYDWNLTLTHQMRRIIKEKVPDNAIDRWRISAAVWICTLLHKADPEHCWKEG